MKKILAPLILAVVAAPASAGPSDFIFMQRNTLDTGNVQRVITSPTTAGFFTYNPTTKLGGYTTLGDGLTLTAGVLSASAAPGPAGPAGPAGANGSPGATGATGPAGTTDWLGITNRPTTLAGFGITDAQSGARAAIGLTTTGTGAATYNATTGVLNIPTPASVTVPTINRVRATTAADGSYVWTLPAACSAGTTPIVSITPESATANDSVSHRIVSATNTTVTIFAGRSPGLVVLGLTVLGIPAGAAIPVHLIAVCP